MSTAARDDAPGAVRTAAPAGVGDGDRAGRPRFTPERIAFGCDYNPEQWDPAVWQEDVVLMREAGIDLVAINIFGWSEVEPEPGRFDFSRLDAVVELLHANGIGMNLGTGTASPPPWLPTRHPETLPVTADGRPANLLSRERPIRIDSRQDRENRAGRPRRSQESANAVGRSRNIPRWPGTAPPDGGP